MDSLDIIALLITTIAWSDGAMLGSGLYLEYIPEHNYTSNVYDTRIRNDSIGTEFGLICNNKWITTIITSMNLFATILSGPLSGFCSDKFGYKKTGVLQKFNQFFLQSHILTPTAF